MPHYVNGKAIYVVGNDAENLKAHIALKQKPKQEDKPTPLKKKSAVSNVVKAVKKSVKKSKK